MTRLESKRALCYHLNLGMKTPYKMSFLLIVKDPVTPRGADTVSFLILAINKGAENQLLRMSGII